MYATDARTDRQSQSSPDLNNLWSGVFIFTPCSELHDEHHLVKLAEKKTPQARGWATGKLRTVELILMEKELGKSITSGEVADFLGVNVKTVRQHYKKLGGIRLGRRYIFFEKGVVNALSKEWEMESPSEKEWQEEREDVQHKERGSEIGRASCRERV